ncbi:DUF4469 domain-containing protein [Parabacteroides sp.]
MATINAIAHKNELTTDITDDYYLTPQVTDTLDVAAIIQRLKAREIATKNVDGAAFVQTFLDECAAASAEGNNIVTSFFRSSIGLKGSVRAGELGHNIPADRLKVSVNLTQGEGARRAVEGAVVHAFEQAGATGPVIQSVTDPTVGKTDSLTLGGMALIEGMRLSLKGDDASVGILFKKVGGSESILILPGKVSPNTPTKLQFALPAAVTAGQWTVSVTSQSSSSSKQLLKTPRTYEYPNPVTVAAEGSDSESPDEI